MIKRSHICLLCQGDDTYPLPAGGRTYHRCRGCKLVFLDHSLHLSRDEEKARYDLHENDVSDAGYRAFLSRATDEVIRLIPPPALGLDYGCGPGPALVAMMREKGYQMRAYDKFYLDDSTVFDFRYDFITCTEVVEHLSEPARELDRIWNLLHPGGLLIIQTKRVTGDERFKTWFYRNDPTHIAFYAVETFKCIAGARRAEVFFPADDVAILRKPQK